jgi:tellurium resistance protein TerD
MTALNLTKGTPLNLSKNFLEEVAIRLFWPKMPQSFDLDAAAIATNAAGRSPDDQHIAWFRQPQIFGGAIALNGDDRRGGTGETITIKLKQLPASIASIKFPIVLFEAATRGQNFGMVTGAGAEIINAKTAEVLGKFNLTEDYSANTAVLVAEVNLVSGDWVFHGLAEGFTGDLNTIWARYNG